MWRYQFTWTRREADSFKKKHKGSYICYEKNSRGRSFAKEDYRMILGISGEDPKKWRYCVVWKI